MDNKKVQEKLIEEISLGLMIENIEKTGVKKIDLDKLLKEPIGESIIIGLFGKKDSLKIFIIGKETLKIVNSDFESLLGEFPEVNWNRIQLKGDELSIPVEKLMDVIEKHERDQAIKCKANRGSERSYRDPSKYLPSQRVKN